jgi:hypothetical protein
LTDQGPRLIARFQRVQFRSLWAATLTITLRLWKSDFHDRGRDGRLRLLPKHDDVSVSAGASTSRNLWKRIAEPQGQNMLRNLLLSATIAFLSMLSFPESHSQVAVYQPEVGKPHPDFILPSIEDGSPIQLSDFRGKKVLLMHFASW